MPRKTKSKKAREADPLRARNAEFPKLCKCAKCERWFSQPRQWCKLNCPACHYTEQDRHPCPTCKKNVVMIGARRDDEYGRITLTCRHKVEPIEWDPAMKEAEAKRVRSAKRRMPREFQE